MYKKWIFYIYEYEVGCKGKNIGFIRLEIRNDQYDLQVQVQPNVEGQQYVMKRFYRKGDQVIFQNIGQEETIVSGFERKTGLVAELQGGHLLSGGIIFLPKGYQRGEMPRRFWVSQWEDSSICWKDSKVWRQVAEEKAEGSRQGRKPVSLLQVASVQEGKNEVVSRIQESKKIEATSQSQECKKAGVTSQNQDGEKIGATSQSQECKKAGVTSQSQDGEKIGATSQSQECKKTGATSQSQECKKTGATDQNQYGEENARAEEYNRGKIEFIEGSSREFLGRLQENTRVENGNLKEPEMAEEERNVGGEAYGSIKEKVMEWKGDTDCNTVEKKIQQEEKNLFTEMRPEKDLCWKDFIQRREELEKSFQKIKAQQKEEQASFYSTEAERQDTDKKQDELMEKPQGTEMPFLWQEGESFLKNHSVLNPFFDAGVLRSVRMEPKDLGLLPIEFWYLANNSFLLHGYYCYRHLLFMKMMQQGEVQYGIGVPGNDNEQEKFMANMFGFTYFKPVRTEERKEFGYWWIRLK